ncbi:hypothetical protein N7512_001766 [Penicillium capsulatum]|nr:hypothetical protein N7512_001766 [Penicillium capsulatum]
MKVAALSFLLAAGTASAGPATEGTTYTDTRFSNHYTGATKAGLIRVFPGSRRGWSDDGKTLPGMLDIEYNPSGATCYGLSASEMVAWVKEFGETYKAKTSRYPMIYTTADWWNTSTGGSTAFSKDYALVLARYSSSVGSIPGGWAHQSIWQNSDSYHYGGDSDIWNGDEDSLKKFAKGT